MDRLPVRKLLISTALAGVVAAGAAGASAWAPLRFGKPGSVGLVVVLTVAVLVGAAGAWALVLLLDRGGDRNHPPVASRLPSSAELRRAFPAAVAMVALVGLLGISRLTLGIENEPVGVEQADTEGREGRPLLFSDDRDSPVRRGGTERPLVPVLDRRAVPVVAALLILLAGGAALIWWLMGRREAADGEGATERIDTAAARNTVLRSIEGMLSDPDPNTAVIGAYARLLQGLADAGVPRRDYEAPVEHLRRALGHLPVRPGPVQRLVALFQVARFSTRALTVEHRDEALAALREVAADLDDPDAVLLVSTPPASRRTRS